MLSNSGNTPETRAAWLPGSATQQGSWSVAIGAALWGLFWIPLRFLDDQGITGLWSIALVMFALVLPATIALVLTKKLHTIKSTDAWIVGCALGLSAVLYFIGVIVSDVIRVIFLFYLLPIWTTISARVLYKEPITKARLFVIILALTGLWLLLGGGSDIPLPRNSGDWCGLLAGICWGVSLSVIRDKSDINTNAMTFAASLSATFMAVVMALLLLNTNNAALSSLPQTDSLGLVLAAAIAFSFVLLYPSLIGQVWGAQRIAAPTAALLTMTEILVATVSAYILIGTTLNAVSMFGASIILLAVVIDIALKYKQPE